MAIRVIGTPELNAAFQAAGDSLRTAAGRAIFRRAAGEVRDAVRDEAPRKKGELKKAVISFLSKRRGKKTEPTAFARVNVLKGHVRARHAHLQEFGTKERRPTRHKFMKFNAELGRELGLKRASISWTVFRKRVRGVKPNPFFQRGVSAAGPRALERVVNESKALIVARFKKASAPQ